MGTYLIRLSCSIFMSFSAAIWYNSLLTIPCRHDFLKYFCSPCQFACNSKIQDQRSYCNMSVSCVSQHPESVGCEGEKSLKYSKGWSVKNSSNHMHKCSNRRFNCLMTIELVKNRSPFFLTWVHLIMQCIQLQMYHTFFGCRWKSPDLLLIRFPVFAKCKPIKVF